MSISFLVLSFSSFIKQTSKSYASHNPGKHLFKIAKLLHDGYYEYVNALKLHFENKEEIKPSTVFRINIRNLNNFINKYPQSVLLKVTRFDNIHHNKNSHINILPKRK
jgi:hypothetical protein